MASGDTIARIAAWFHMTVEELLAANPSIVDPNRIAVGNVISIPARSVGTVIRIEGPDYRHLRLKEDADLVAVGNPNLEGEVVHWQLAEASVEPSTWGPGQEWRNLDYPSFNAGGRSSPVLAEYLDAYTEGNQQGRHVWRAYRAWVAATGAHPELWTQIVVVEWGGTGPCPAEETNYVERLVAPDGTTYDIVPGEDAEFNGQWTIVTTNAGGTSGAGWRQALESCWEPYEAVVGSDATAYLAATYRTGEPLVDFPPMRLIVAGPEGFRSERDLAWAHLERAPDGTVFVSSMEVDEAGPHAPTFLSMTVAALDPDGNPKPGWPFTTTDPSSRPVFGSDGTVYVAQTTDAGDRIIALGADGQMKEGWPYAVPGKLEWTVCGAGCPNVPRWPHVSPDGSIYDSFISNVHAVEHGSQASGIYIVGPDGQVEDGWPYVLPKGTVIPNALGTPGWSSFAPVMADDGRIYVPWYDERSGTPHDELVCLTPGGTMCPGWPVRLPHPAAGDPEIDEHGNLQVLLREPGSPGQTKITVRPNGTIVK